MTDFSANAYSGLTRRGLEDLNSFIEGGALASRSLIEVAARQNGQAIAGTVRPSRRSYEIEWENAKEERDLRKRHVQSEPLLTGIATLAVPLFSTALVALTLQDAVRKGECLIMLLIKLPAPQTRSLQGQDRGAAV